MAQNQNSRWELDDILIKLQFGPYQYKIIILIALMIMYSNINPLSFTLTAADLNYRCRIPECEDHNSTSYLPKWIQNTVPFHDEQPYKCKRFKLKNNGFTFKNNVDTCEAQFDTNVTEECTNWVFETEEITIVNSFHIMCENERYLLSLIGTFNSVGQFFGIPFFGILSDRYGRKFVTILSAVVSAVLGVCRGLSLNYTMFAIFEFLESFFGCAIYGVGFTLGMELVRAEKRALVATIFDCFYPIGAVFLGCVAWYFQDWRKVLIICYSPAILFVLYIWMIPESIRWLLTHGHQSQTVMILQKISRANNIKLPKNVFEEKPMLEEKTFSLWLAVNEVVRSKSILLRLINCSFSWFACTLIYYGLNIHSVDLVGNKYLNFIFSNVVEIPGIILGGLIMKYIKRRISLCAMFILSGISCIACEFTPTNLFLLKLSVYLLSKCAISIAFYLIYAYSAEMFPTELRLSLCGFVSMVGRIGSMLSPQIILTGYTIGKHIPLVTFGLVATTAGALATLLPETLDKKLPDTIAEAEKIDEISSD